MYSYLKIFTVKIFNKDKLYILFFFFTNDNNYFTANEFIHWSLTEEEECCCVLLRVCMDLINMGWDGWNTSLMRNILMTSKAAIISSRNNNKQQYVYLCINAWLLIKSSWLTDMLMNVLCSSTRPDVTHSPDTVKQFDMKQLLWWILRSYLKIFFSELQLSLRSWRCLNQLILSNHGIWVFAHCEPACVHISTI